MGIAETPTHRSLRNCRIIRQKCRAPVPMKAKGLLDRQLKLDRALKWPTVLPRTRFQHAAVFLSFFIEPYLLLCELSVMWLTAH